MAVVRGNLQVARFGTTLPIAPAVIVTGPAGAVPDVPVTFSVEAGGGSVTGASAVTGPDGVAQVESWTLGPASGVQTLRARAGDVSVQIVATAVGPLDKVAGDGAVGLAGNFTPVLPVVQLNDESGRPIRGVPVTFRVAGGGGSLSYAVDTTGVSGQASPGSWRFGTAGLQTLEVSVAGVDPVTFSATATVPPAPSFDIDLRFVDPQPGTDQRAAFLAARDRWERIIVGDVPDVNTSVPANACGTDSLTPPLPSIPAPIDDVVIFAGIRPIDGPGGILAQAGPCVIRTAGSLPVVGLITFDSDDLDLLTENAGLADVATHEMAHVLGFGIIWENLGLITGAGTADPLFLGVGARQGFASLQRGTRALLQEVPLENTGGGGTRDGHWRETVFGAELLTGFYTRGSSNPLSVLTTAAMRDMGYLARDDQADSFAIGFLMAARRGAGDASELREQLAPWPIRTLDGSGRLGPAIAR